MADEGDFKTDINLYEKARPKYTRESVEYLLDKLKVHNNNAKALTILELGAGTGKCTRVLIEILRDRKCNARVIASDSQESMVEKFKKLVPGVEIIRCKAEDIHLPDCSIDVVIIAQAFHWFANAASVAEIHRVLIPNGRLGMIWNSRNHAEIEWVAKAQLIIEPYVQRTKTPNNLDNTWMVPIKESKLFTELEGHQDLRQCQVGSADDMVDVIMCISSIANSSEDEKKDVEMKMRDLLKNHPDLKGKSEYHLQYVIPIYWCSKM